MDQITRADHNLTYKGDPEQNVRDLSCVRFEFGHIAGDFKATPEEVSQIAAGGTVRIHYWQEPIPPVALEVMPPECTVHEGVEMDWIEGIGYVCPNCASVQNGHRSS